MRKDFYDHEDRVITEFLKSLGSWSKHIVVGGGYAPIIYRLYLSGGIGSLPVATRDIDSIIPRRFPESYQKNVSKHLYEAGFEQKYRDRSIPASEYYVKTIEGNEIEIEFLTDNLVRNKKSINVEISGVIAQPLSYLEMSLLNTREFITTSGVKGLVVSPGAWMFHKGLTFPKRTTSIKIYKDLYGIWYVASQLAGFSSSAKDELLSLAKKHPRWFKTFQKNLLDWLEKASPLDFVTLMTQDPEGKIDRINFAKQVIDITTDKAFS